jgi:hypothetical protein
LFDLIWAEKAKELYYSLKADASKEKQYKTFKKAIIQLAKDPKYPGLQSHEFTSLKGPKGEKIFESYAENNTPGAYRIFWFYGPQRSVITIFFISPHP